MKKINIKVIAAIIAALLIGGAIAMMVIKREGFMLGPNTNSLNGCQDLKYKDILDKFNGDEDKLKAVLHDSAHCPMSVLYNDNYAPLMGTYLMNYDPCVYNFGGDCKLPHEQH